MILSILAKPKIKIIKQLSTLLTLYPVSTHLKVAGVLVILVGGDLQLLLDPFLQLVCVTAEKLEAVRVLQFLPAHSRQLLKAPVAVQDLLPTLLDVIGCLQNFRAAGIHSLENTHTIYTVSDSHCKVVVTNSAIFHYYYIF